MNSVSGLSIIMPAYNEEDALEGSIRAALAGIPAGVGTVELIVVDDGSTDRTPQVIDRIAASNAAVRSLHHDRNQGKGAALRTGFSQAHKEWILFVDADDQIGTAALSKALYFTRDHDIIIGYRHDRTLAPGRKMLSWCYRHITACLLGLSVKDPGCPFKLFSRPALGMMQPAARGFIIDAELLFQAGQLGLRVKEIPVESCPRRKGSSTVTLRQIAGTLLELVLMRLSLIKNKQPAHRARTGPLS